MTYIKPDRFLTLTEFRATGRDVDQATLEEAAGTDLGNGEGGRLYVGNCYIEREQGEWYLTIMNDSWRGPLRTLEAILYAFARTEILPTPDDVQATLAEEWGIFCRDEGLGEPSADEVPMESLGAAQRSYVRDFIKRWDRLVSEVAVPADSDSDRIAALEFALRNMLAAFGNLSPSNPAVTHARWVLKEKR